MINKLILLLNLLFILNGCFHVSSGTVLTIYSNTELDYKEISEDIRSNIIKFNTSFDCHSNEASTRYQKKDQVICNYGTLYTENNRNSINVIFSGGSEFWIPTKEIITDEHKQIQKLFLKLGLKYKKKYKDVKVIFYHDDLPKEGKRLF